MSSTRRGLLTGARLHVAVAFVAASLLVACAPEVQKPPQAPPALPAPHGTVAAGERGGSLRVRFVDVGQGDAAIVETGDGHAWLVDAGPPDGAERLAVAIGNLHRTLDGVFLSHAHNDHYGGLLPIADRGAVSPRFFLPAIAPDPTKTFVKLLDKLRASGTNLFPLQRGADVALGAFTSAHAILPVAPPLAHTRSDMNANSLVLTVTHHASPRDVRVLFEGDAEAETESRLLEHPDEIGADVLKVAHHGSRYASQRQLLEAVHPRFAVISCGTNNDYGHPHAGALERLRGIHAEVHRTDLEGDVVLSSDDHGVRVEGSRPAALAALLAPGAPKGHREVEAP